MVTSVSGGTSNGSTMVRVPQASSGAPREPSAKPSAIDQVVAVQLAKLTLAWTGELVATNSPGGTWPRNRAGGPGAVQSAGAATSTVIGGEGSSNTSTCSCTTAHEKGKAP